MKIELKHEILNDEYTSYVYDTFDIQNRENTITTIDAHLGGGKGFEWNIGIIIGNSGSGKSTILKKLGEVKSYSFDNKKPLISNFNWMTPKEATFLLTSIGLSSVPSWLRPYHTLSNGEQYRANLAYAISSSKDGDVILIDEYTSVVDRDVAKAMSFSLQKYIRRENKKIVLASCHHDILEWLLPDWTCSPQKGGVLERCEYLRQGRPKIELQVSRVSYDTWHFFKKHHYLTEELNKSFNLLLFTWHDKPVGIVVYRSQPTGAVPNGCALARTVVLPDFQGMGIGSKISEFTASILVKYGKRVFTKTINPALGEYREKSSNWRPTSKNKVKRNDGLSDKSSSTRVSRSSYCHEYIGPPLRGYENIVLPANDYKNNKP